MSKYRFMEPTAIYKTFKTIRKEEGEDAAKEYLKKRTEDKGS